MNSLGDLVVGGAVSGAIYSLIAAGLVLTYSSTGVFNLSYAAIAFVSAYTFYELHIGLGWSIAPAAVVVILVMAPLLGLFFERVIFRSLASSTESAKVTATIGLLIALPALVQLIVTGGISVFHWNIPSGQSVADAPGIGPAPAVNWHLSGGLILDSDQFIVLVVAAICALGLWVMLRHTAFGLRMRAVVDSPNQAQLSGINILRMPTAAWVIGTMFASLAGIVAAPIFNNLEPSAYTTTVFVATAAVVLGRFKSIPWAFAGGMLIGILQNIVAIYATFAKSIVGFSDAVPFIVLLFGLVMLGRERGRRTGLVDSSIDATVHEDATALATHWTKRRFIICGIVLVLYIVYLEGFASQFWQTANILGLGLSLAFLSFVVITGMGGMLNLAPAAFVMTSGLTVGLMIDRFHVPWFPAFLIGIVAAVVIGIIVALPALRLGGLALALATLALAFVADTVLFNWSWMTNGLNGWTIRSPRIGSVGVASNKAFSIILIVIIGIVVVLIINLHRSPTGRAIFAVRNSEAAAMSSGVSAIGAKLIIFIVGAAIAGLGGAVLATYNGSIASPTYTATIGLTWFAAVVLWGVRRPGAAIAAGLSTALFPTLLQTGFHFPAWVPSFFSWNGTSSIYIPSIVFGLGAIQMAKEPDGIFRMMEKQRDARRLRKRTVAVDIAPAESLKRSDLHGTSAVAGAPVTDNGASTSPPARVVSSSPNVSGAESEIIGTAYPNTNTILSVERVRAGYGELDVLFDVDLVVPRGSITALVGANGAGKSTLCSVIAGLIPVKSGTIRFEGDDVTSKPAFHRAQQGLVLTPESRGIFPGLTVEENLSIRLDSGQRKSTYDRFALLASRRNVHAGNLSGGEQQVLALAPVLALSPKMLVADEPTLGLAPLIVTSLLDLFNEIRANGTSILLVEEKARSILDLADYVVYFELGKVVGTGTVSDSENESLLASYLGGNDHRDTPSAESTRTSRNDDDTP